MHATLKPMNKPRNFYLNKYFLKIGLEIHTSSTVCSLQYVCHAFLILTPTQVNKISEPISMCNWIYVNRDVIGVQRGFDRKSSLILRWLLHIGNIHAIRVYFFVEGCKISGWLCLHHPINFLNWHSSTISIIKYYATLQVSLFPIMVTL